LLPDPPRRAPSAQSAHFRRGSPIRARRASGRRRISGPQRLQAAASDDLAEDGAAAVAEEAAAAVPSASPAAPADLQPLVTGTICDKQPGSQTGKMGRGPAQWAVKSVLAKHFNSFQVNEYFCEIL
jgi:hypothetical protein